MDHREDARGLRRFRGVVYLHPDELLRFLDRWSNFVWMRDVPSQDAGGDVVALADATSTVDPSPARPRGQTDQPMARSSAI